jgi:uncharacterized protein with HEPN domain
MPRDRQYLQDILNAGRLALEYVSGKSREEFMGDVQCQDAVIRRLEVLGEAARRVSPEFSETRPELPWSKMVSMRNFLIHEYDDVDFAIVWETVKNDLPPLIAALEEILSEPAP